MLIVKQNAFDFVCNIGQHIPFVSVFTHLSGKCCNKLNKRVKHRERKEQANKKKRITRFVESPWVWVVFCTECNRLNVGRERERKNWYIQTKQLSLFSIYYIFSILRYKWMYNVDVRNFNAQHMKTLVNVCSHSSIAMIIWENEVIVEKSIEVFETS